MFSQEKNKTASGPPRGTRHIQRYGTKLLTQRSSKSRGIYLWKETKHNIYQKAKRLENFHKPTTVIHLMTLVSPSAWTVENIHVFDFLIAKKDIHTFVLPHPRGL
jgi:hypothetical protein